LPRNFFPQFQNEPLRTLHGIEEALAARMQGSVVVAKNPGPRVSKILDQAQKMKMSVTILTKDDFLNLARNHGVDDRIKGVLFFPRYDEATSKRKLQDLSPFLDSQYPEGGGNETGLFLVLQEITDPQNLGAIVRTADQFAADGVVFPQRRSAGLGPVVSRVSSGADQYVNLFEVVNLVRAIEELKTHGFWIYGADMGGNKVSDAPLKGRIAIILGSEGRGIGPLVRKTCDGILSIPTGGKIDSLNVSVAAGILSYEIRRQQQFPYSS